MAFETIKPAVTTAKPPPQKKKKISKDHVLIIVGILCASATIGILMMIVNRGRVAQPVVSVGIEEERQEVKVKGVDWRKSLFDLKRFRELKNPLPAPLDIGTTGNPKPFAE